MRKLTGWMLLGLLLLAALTSWATDISHTPAIPGDLLPTDKVPLGRPTSGAADGQGTAYTATVKQISRAVFINFSSLGLMSQSGLTAGVTRFNGRDGAVMPLTGDYTAAMVGADPLGAAATVQGSLNTHTGRTDNPHSVTKAQVGLGNVDNTSDANKPVSTATQNALNLKANSTSLPATSSAITHYWLNSYNASTSTFTRAQPDYSDLTGTPTLGTAAAKNVGTTAGTVAAGDDPRFGAGSTTLANVVSVTLAAAPRTVWTVYGDSSDGGTTPDATTQASINALEAAGVPAANIRWLYEAGAAVNQMAISSLALGTSIDTPTLVMAGGTLVVSDINAATSIDNTSITSIMVFSLADVTAATSVDTPTLALGGGLLAMADITAPTLLDAPTLALAGGALAMADITAGTSIDSSLVMTQPAAAPATPAGISLVGGANQLTVNWTDVSGETSYNIYYSIYSTLNADGMDGALDSYPVPSNATAGKITGIAANSVSKIITGLPNGTTYYVRVSAVNSVGESALSTAIDGIPTNVFSDTFNDLSNWAASAGRTDTMPTIVNGQAYFAGIGSAEHTFVSPVGTVTVQWDMKQTGRMYIQAAGSTSLTNNAYLAMVNGTTATITKQVNGTGTTLATGSYTGDTSMHTYKLILNRSTGVITFTRDGVTLATITDNTFTSFGKINMLADSASGTYYDNISVY